MTNLRRTSKLVRWILPSVSLQASITHEITNSQSSTLFQTRPLSSLSSFHTQHNNHIDHSNHINYYNNTKHSQVFQSHHNHHRRWSSSSQPQPPPPSNVAEEFDLTPPDTGIIRIDGYDDTGFIVGDVQVEGSILCYGDLWLSWKPQRMNDITIDALKLIDLVKPIPDLVVIGSGKRIRQVPSELKKALHDKNVAIEIADTVNAVSTFNILNQEGRKVVGAMLPAGIDD